MDVWWSYGLWMFGGAMGGVIRCNGQFPLLLYYLPFYFWKAKLPKPIAPPNKSHNISS
jgi:hypothetical protein